MVTFDGNPSNLSCPLPRNVGEMHARVSYRHFELVEIDQVFGLPLDEKLRAATIDWWIERYGARPTAEERAEWMKIPSQDAPQAELPPADEAEGAPAAAESSKPEQAPAQPGAASSSSEGAPPNAAAAAPAVASEPAAARPAKEPPPGRGRRAGG